MYSPSLRRVPVQRRSADRLDRILDACAQLLDQSGYELITTRAVAARAGVPIGSVYRYFSDKRAMAEALAHRNLDAYTSRVSDRLAERGPIGWHDALDIFIGEYLEMKRTAPGFTLIDFGPPDPPGQARSGTTAGTDEVQVRVAEAVNTLLRAHLGLAPSPPLELACLVAVQAADALLALAFRTRPAGDPALIEETRRLLHAYIGTLPDAR